MEDLLSDLERQDAEWIAALIIAGEKTDVTEAQVEEWGDYDLLTWLADWDNEWAQGLLAERT